MFHYYYFYLSIFFMTWKKKKKHLLHQFSLSVNNFRSGLVQMWNNCSNYVGKMAMKSARGKYTMYLYWKEIFERFLAVLVHVERCYVETMPCQTASTFREQKKWRENVEAKRVSNGLNILSTFVESCWEMLKGLRHGWRILKKLAIFFKFAVRNPS